MKPLKIIHLALLFICQGVFSQNSPDYKGGLSIKFDEEGKKELRILAAGQFQAIYAACLVGIRQSESQVAPTHCQARQARPPFLEALLRQGFPKGIVLPTFCGPTAVKGKGPRLRILGHVGAT